MTTPEQLDQMITKKQRGDVIMPQSNEEKLALDLMELAESFKFSSEFDERLIEHFRKSKESRHADKQPAKPSKVLHIFAISAAAISIIIVAVLMIPPAHTFAQEIIRQIGTFIIRDQDPGTQPAVPPEQQEGFPLIPIYNIEEVNAELDFSVYTPSYAPLPTRPVYYALPNDAPTYVVTDYRRGVDSIVTIFQWRSDTDAPRGDFLIDDAPIQDVTVNGAPAVWIEQHWAGSHDFNSLLWEADGFTFALQSPSLTLDEMIQIAESLAP